jgi:hypothetical protein
VRYFSIYFYEAILDQVLKTRTREIGEGLHQKFVQPLRVRSIEV